MTWRLGHASSRTLRLASRSAWLLLALVICLLVLATCWQLEPEGAAAPEGTASTGHAELVTQVQRLMAAPPGTVSELRVPQGELESYLNAEALPLLGISGVRVSARLNGQEATLAAFSADSRRPLGLLSLALSGGQNQVGVQIARLRLGPLGATPRLTRLLERIANATLASGELGFVLRELRLADGTIYVVVVRC